VRVSKAWASLGSVIDRGSSFFRRIGSSKAKLVSGLGGSGRTGAKFENRGGRQTERDPAWPEMSGDFFNPQFVVQEDSIKRNPHTEGMNSFAGVDPEAGSGFKFFDSEQASAALGAVGSEANFCSKDYSARDIFHQVFGSTRSASHVAAILIARPSLKEMCQAAGQSLIDNT
jgi:hypothetical protein